MVGRNKFFAVALGVAAAVSLASGDASAAPTAYAGTGTGGGSAVQNWITNVGSYLQKTTATQTGSNPYTVPLNLSTGMTMTLSAGSGALVTTGILAGTLAGAIPTGGQVENGAAAGRTITLAGFSSSVTAFGFWLQQASAVTYTSDIVITLTSASGTSTVTLPGTPADCVTPNASNVCGSTLTNTTAEFIGFSGISGLTSISISNPGSVRYAMGDYLEAPVPEPASLALLGAGLVGLGMARRRKKA